MEKGKNLFEPNLEIIMKSNNKIPLLNLEILLKMNPFFIKKK